MVIVTAPAPILRCGHTGLIAWRRNDAEKGAQRYGGYYLTCVLPFSTGFRHGTHGYGLSC